MTQKQDTKLLEEEENVKETQSPSSGHEEAEKPHIPPQKVSRFSPQSGSKFGKGATNFSPPNKQRPGRAAGRGR